MTLQMLFFFFFVIWNVLETCIGSYIITGGLQFFLLSAAFAKSGPLDIPLGKGFLLFYCPWKGFRTHVSKIGSESVSGYGPFCRFGPPHHIW